LFSFAINQIIKVQSSSTKSEKTMNTVIPMLRENTQSWQDIVSEIGKQLDTNAQRTDNSNEFAYQNYELLHERGLFRMMIPVELGGGGASYSELVEVIREIGQHCGSTALSFSMHSHPIAVNVFKHLRGDEQATATLRNIAHNDLIIAGTGANDWLASSGNMTPVEGGYRVNAHKHFVSGAPGAQVFVTSANLKSKVGLEVLHFAIPFKSEGIKIHDNWNTHGMRATGSNDVTLDNVFVPDSAIIVRRPSGEWHPMWNVILPTAMPLIISAYVGLADAAVNIARSAVAKRPDELAALSGQKSWAVRDSLKAIPLSGYSVTLKPVTSTRYHTDVSTCFRGALILALIPFMGKSSQFTHKIGRKNMSNRQSPNERTLALRDSLSQYPTGVAIVTARSDKGEPVGMTINSFNSISLSPPLLAWCIDNHAASFEVFKQAQNFAITILAQDQTELATRFATRGADKFTGPKGSGLKAPIIQGGCAWFHCKTYRQYSLGDHLMMVGMVIAYDRHAKPPMVFHNGQFRQIEMMEARPIAA
jgi:acyl-CoA dehydrogenase